MLPVPTALGLMGLSVPPDMSSMQGQPVAISKLLLASPCAHPASPQCEILSPQCHRWSPGAALQGPISHRIPCSHSISHAKQQ